jgi:hypothetical protein
VVAPVGTVAVICVVELTVNVALSVPNLTSVILIKVEPVMVTLVPTGPLAGVKLSIFGVTLKIAVLIAVPA